MLVLGSCDLTISVPPNCNGMMELLLCCWLLCCKECSKVGLLRVVVQVVLVQVVGGQGSKKGRMDID